MRQCDIVGEPFREVKKKKPSLVARACCPIMVRRLLNGYPAVVHSGAVQETAAWSETTAQHWATPPHVAAICRGANAIGLNRLGHVRLIGLRLRCEIAARALVGALRVRVEFIAGTRAAGIRIVSARGSCRALRIRIARSGRRLGNSACRQDRKSTCCEKCTCSIQSHNYLHETKGQPICHHGRIESERRAGVKSTA